MSDIDFVELDKAVNSLVNKNKLAEPVVSFKNNAPLKENSAESATLKPKGRFMDVFHHSSDMTTDKKVETPEKSEIPPPVSRKIVKPIYNDIAPPARQGSTPVSTPAYHGYEPAAKSDWPDPIEVATPKTATDSSDVPPPAATTTSSLFLPDTKVEKRPLGGVSSEPEQKASKDNDKTEEDSDEKQTQSTKPAPEASLPPEFEADLVAIEEGALPNTSDGTSENKELAAQKPEPNFVQDKDPLETELFEETPEHTKSQAPSGAQVSKAELSGLLAAGSIPQQYHTTATASDSPNDSHPMFFDADQYNKAPSPGAHKAHKTTLFQWIFIVVGLLLLGATLGAALFVFVSGQ